MNILVAGDYCPQHKVAEMLLKEDYSFLDEVRNIITSADYSIVNLECPICETNETPIVKCGPALKTTRNIIDSIKYAGFNCVTLANNHFRDYGDVGCITTIETIKKHNVDYVGGGCNLLEAQKVLYKDVKGERLAIINICENEFSIATETSAGAAPLDLVDNYRQITEARNNADYVLVIVHGGHEMYNLPSLRMKKTYRHYIDIGADAVVNHHQHCFSGYEFYNGNPIVYGVGNFCFGKADAHNAIWDDGYLVNISFTKSGISINLTPYKQYSDNNKANIAIIDTTEFNQRIEKINEIIADNEKLTDNFNKWVDSCYKSKLSLFSSYHNKYLNAAASRGFIPRPASKREMLSLLNNVACEAHRDVTLAVLNNICNQ